NASGNLQDMITASSNGDQIWVAAGTYLPGTSFEMKNGVMIFGGFPEAGGDWDLRSWRDHKTMLMGIPGYSVIRSYRVDPSAVLDGFIIQGGSTSGGGGIFNEEASPTL